MTPTDRIRRNERLLANKDFRELLFDIAKEARFLGSTAGLPEDLRSRVDARRDIVSRIVSGAGNGGDWLKEFSARMFAARFEERKNGDRA